MSEAVKRGYRTAAALLDRLGLKTAVRTYVLPRLIAAVARDRGAAEGPEALAAAYAHGRLAQLAGDRRPILVGPWLSEVGFELLYWIPFLQWAAEAYGLAPERLIAVTRGGAGLWYGNVCGRTLELFELITPQAFQQGNQARWSEAKGQKQGFASDFERRCLELAAGRLGLAPGDYELLPPSLMHNIFWYLWQGKAPLALIERHARFRRLPPGPADQGPPLELPERFAALRFYRRDSFPDDQANRGFVRDLARRLTARGEVVLLDPGLAIDDHGDFALDDHPRLHRLPGPVDPAANLALQSRVIARAELFVGTYGGLAYLAPFLGVPSLSFASTADGLKPVHGEVAARAFQQLEVPFLKLATGDLALLERWLGAP